MEEGENMKHLMILLFSLCKQGQILPLEKSENKEKRKKLITSTILYTRNIHLLYIQYLLTSFLIFMQLCDIYDDGKLQNNSNAYKYMWRMSAILLASMSGNPDTLRLFLDDRIFNPLVKFKGATALHYATNAMMPTIELRSNTTFKVGHFLLHTDLAHLEFSTCRYEEEFKDIKLTPASYLGRKACVTMLL